MAARVWLKSDIICGESIVLQQKRIPSSINSGQWEFMLRLLLHWHIHFIKSFFIQILSSVFIVTLESVCERAKGFSGKDPATTDFEVGILKYFRWDLQFFIIINIAWLYTTLETALGREKGGPGLPLEGSAQVLGSDCEDTLGEQRLSLRCIPIHLQGG